MYVRIAYDRNTCLVYIYVSLVNYVVRLLYALNHMDGRRYGNDVRVRLCDLLRRAAIRRPSRQ